MYKIILTTAEHEQSYYRGDSTTLKVETFDNIADLLNNRKIQQEMLALGWRSPEQIEKVKQEHEFLDEYVMNYYNAIYRVDITNLTATQLDHLASGNALYRRVSLAKILPPEDYKKYEKSLKQAENRKKNAEAAKKKEALKRKQRKIAAAKKLLAKVKEEEANRTAGRE